MPAIFAGLLACLPAPPCCLQFLATSRFLLRRRRAAGGGEGEAAAGPAAAPGAGAGAAGRSVMEDVPACQPNGDEVFLLHLGFEAPGTYELYIASATQVCVYVCASVRSWWELCAGIA